MPKGFNLNRRNFLRTSSGLMGASLVQALRTHRVLGANEKIGFGLIGSGGRGQYLLQRFKELGCEPRAVCDVYEPNLQAGIKLTEGQGKSYDRYRRLLDDKSVDAVIIATPDHWHAQMAIDAVAAGKDVYLEKPMCHTVEEGFRLIDAVRRSKQVLQVGTQRRSYDLFMEGKKIMDSGKLGKVRLVTAWWMNNQASLRSDPLGGQLDWKEWLGSAPERPLDPTRFFSWYYFYDYSGGMMIGQGAHIIDAVAWFMNSTYPSAVNCSAGQVHLEGAEIPETTIMNVEYPKDYVVTFTVGYKAMRYAMNNDQLKQFHGEQARFDMARESFALYPQSRETEMKPELEKKQYGTFDGATRSHIANFLDCMHTRKDPNATVEMGHYTSVALCMALESLRSGRRVRWDGAQKRIVTS